MIVEGSKKHKEILSEHQALMTAIGKKIKELRTNQNKTYTDMAIMIGISRQEYNLIELGKIYFKFSTFLKILDYHRITYADFSKTL